MNSIFNTIASACRPQTTIMSDKQILATVKLAYESYECNYSLNITEAARLAENLENLILEITHKEHPDIVTLLKPLTDCETRKEVLDCLDYLFEDCKQRLAYLKDEAYDLADHLAYMFHTQGASNVAYLMNE